MSTEAFAFNCLSESPIPSCYSSTWVLIPKWIGVGWYQKLVQHFSKVKICSLSPKYYCFICLLLRYQQSNVPKATILPTASSQGSCDHRLSIHHQQPLRFRFLLAYPLHPLRSRPHFFVLLVVTTILLLPTLLRTIFMVHFRNRFLKIHLTCLVFSWSKSRLHENDSQILTDFSTV